MKVIFVALAVFAVGVNAVPKSPESRFIDGIIISAIEDAIAGIQERGLDPLIIENESFEVKAPVTDLFSAAAIIEDFVFKGLSNIRIDSMNFSILALRLRFTITLPKLSATLGSATAELNLGNSEFSAAASGSLAIKEIKVSGDVRVGLGIGGVSIRDVIINFSVGNIQSDQKVVVFGRDISDTLNKVLGEVIPDFLNENEDDINTLLAYLIKRIAENALD